MHSLLVMELGFGICGRAAFITRLGDPDGFFASVSQMPYKIHIQYPSRRISSDPNTDCGWNGKMSITQALAFAAAPAKQQQGGMIFKTISVSLDLGPMS